LKRTPGRADRVRVFFALWPAPAVRTALAAHAQKAQAECGGRAMRSENIHLTLFFVGSVERERIRELERAAGLVRGAAFSLVIDQLGYWRHNAIVWAGATECPTALANLASDLRTALAGIGIEGEDRPYVPHITLVRDAQRRPASRTIDACVWDAHEYVLVESVQVAGGVRYEPFARWPLS
jgi:RNA 2',3'-cyclic 3'-phosphodiesterase